MEQYQPGAHKLMYHPEHINSMLRGKAVAPIHLSIWPTPKCQMSCPFCSFAVGIKGETVELDADALLRAVLPLVPMGLKAVEFSGGGEPTLWPALSGTILRLTQAGIKCALITNGVSFANVSGEARRALSWVRFSLRAPAHAEKVLRHLPGDFNFTASYMVPFGENLEYLHAMTAYARENNLILRVAVPQPATQEWTDTVKAAVRKPAFFTEKKLGPPAGCYMPWVRAAIDWRGNFLPCPGIQLSPENVGYVPDRYVLCKMRDIEQWLRSNPPHDMGHRCPVCVCGHSVGDYMRAVISGRIPKDADFV